MNQKLNAGPTIPIASLSPSNSRWVIKVRVTSKSDIRTWKNAKGKGKFFNMDLMDESGEIRATAFKEQCNKFYKMIEVDRVFFISKCQLKPVKKEFSTLKNDYEMTFSSETVVQPCEEDDSSGIPKIKNDIVPISQIGNMEPTAALESIFNSSQQSISQSTVSPPNTQPQLEEPVTMTAIRSCMLESEVRIKQILLGLVEKVQALEKEVCDLEKQGHPAAILSPFQNAEEFLEFEKAVQGDTALFDQLKSNFKDISTRNNQQFVRAGWKMVMDDSVAVQFSWRGTDNKKSVRDFSTTLALRNAYVEKTGGLEEDFVIVTKSFFQYAQTRLTKNMKKTTNQMARSK